MSKEKNVVEYYVLCNKLKDVVRTGWKDWNVKRQRVESIAEHIFGTQMLAIAMWSEYNYDIDLSKVLTMLAVHETEEIVIGDLTQFQIEKAKKIEMGHKAVEQIFAKLHNGKTIRDLIFEFDERKTPEAQFAYFCDKLECDIQCKLYDEQKCVDVAQDSAADARRNARVKEMLEKGFSWSEMWIKFGQEKYNYDKNFMAVSEYINQNEISISQEKEN